MEGEPASWWSRTRSLPSSLTRRKNFIFQVTSFIVLVIITFIFKFTNHVVENVQIHNRHKKEADPKPKCGK